jgi:hypothetical protein
MCNKWLCATKIMYKGISVAKQMVVPLGDKQAQHKVLPLRLRALL